MMVRAKTPEEMAAWQAEMDKPATKGDLAAAVRGLSELILYASTRSPREMWLPPEKPPFQQSTF